MTNDSNNEAVGSYRILTCLYTSASIKLLSTSYVSTTSCYYIYNSNSRHFCTLWSANWAYINVAKNLR